MQHESEWKTYKDQQSYRGQSTKNKTRRGMAIQCSGALSTREKTQSSEFISGNVVSSVTYQSSGSGNKSDITYIDPGDYCGVCFAANHATLQCCHIADHNKFFVSRNCNYQSSSGPGGDIRSLNPTRQTRRVAQQKVTTLQTTYNSVWKTKETFCETNGKVDGRFQRIKFDPTNKWISKQCHAMWSFSIRPKDSVEKLQTEGAGVVAHVHKHHLNEPVRCKRDCKKEQRKRKEAIRPSRNKSKTAWSHRKSRK